MMARTEERNPIRRAVEAVMGPQVRAVETSRERRLADVIDRAQRARTALEDYRLADVLLVRR